MEEAPTWLVGDDQASNTSAAWVTSNPSSMRSRVQRYVTGRGSDGKYSVCIVCIVRAYPRQSTWRL